MEIEYSIGSSVTIVVEKRVLFWRRIVAKTAGIIVGVEDGRYRVLKYGARESVVEAKSRSLRLRKAEPPVGDIVTIRGVENAALNDAEGIIVGTDNGNYRVFVTSGHADKTIIVVKPSTVFRPNQIVVQYEPGTAVLYKGRRSVVVDIETICVEGKVLQAKSFEVQAVGRVPLIEMFGLKTAELNGAQGYEISRRKDRVLVYIPSLKKTVAIKKQNIRDPSEPYAPDDPNFTKEVHL